MSYERIIRRGKTEAKKLSEKYASTNVEFLTDPSDIGYNSNIVAIIQVTIGRDRVEIIIGPEYPFKPPQVRINQKSYMNSLNSKDKLYLGQLWKIRKVKCLCCYSLLCAGNWCPVVTMVKLCEEIELNHRFRDYMIRLRFLINVNRKLYGNILPPEMIEAIMPFLY